MTYLRYAPDIETPAPDEQTSIEGIIQGMTQQSKVVEKRQHHAVRASHAKSSACVVGELDIPEGLPPELAQGLFARPGTHKVAVRFAPGAGRDPGRPGVHPSRHVDQGVRSSGREAARP